MHAEKGKTEKQTDWQTGKSTKKEEAEDWSWAWHGSRKYGAGNEKRWEEKRETAKFIRLPRTSKKEKKRKLQSFATAKQ